MKLLATVVAMLVIAEMAMAQGSTRADHPYSHVITGTNASMILPPVRPRDTADWAPLTAYSVNDIIKIPRGSVNSGYTYPQPLYFVCIVAQTTGSVISEPKWHIDYTNAADIIDSGVSWRWCRNRRNAIIISNIGNTETSGTMISSNVYLSFGINNLAQAEKGLCLRPDNNGIVNIGYGGVPCWQGAIWAITDTAADKQSITVHQE